LFGFDTAVSKKSREKMKLRLNIEIRQWPLREPFVVSRGVEREFKTVQVTLIDGQGHCGRGEACPVYYAGESIASIAAAIEQVRIQIESGVTCRALLNILPAGGARCAVDAALWDLEAKSSGRSAFSLAGIEHPVSVCTAYTIGIRTIDEYERAARGRMGYRLLKVKVGANDPIRAIEAVRRGAPQSALIVDPNQAWDVDTLRALAPPLADLGVILLEQPIAVGLEPALDGYRCPIRLCADELINNQDDLEKARNRFDVVNIKLEKAGGLTAALQLADSAQRAGFDLMVGTMGGSSLGMAPALILAQHCQFVDLDAPLLQSADWPDGLRYKNGVIQVPQPSFWG
jgi:L-alanine-DL-glutamate epimerase-like enolase superfamily enzyme